MPFHQQDHVRYFTFDSFDDHDLIHAVVTRRGGVSPSPWHSLNVGGTVGDEPTRVSENRQKSFQAIGLTLENMYDVWQVHGVDVVCTDRARPEGEPHLQADAILTDKPGLALFMRFADCVPILLYDHKRRVIGLVHAGWKGTVNKVAKHAVEAMMDKYGSSPGNIAAALGPSIGAHHYKVGKEVVAQVRETFGPNASQVLLPSLQPDEDTRMQFDLWEANRFVLDQAGVKQIEICRICTACNLNDWYSHRGENGRTGRFGVMIVLPE
jgi:hypothetical protein